MHARAAPRPHTCWRVLALVLLGYVIAHGAFSRVGSGGFEPSALGVGGGATVRRRATSASARQPRLRTAALPTIALAPTAPPAMPPDGVDGTAGDAGTAAAALLQAREWLVSTPPCAPCGDNIGSPLVDARLCLTFAQMAKNACTAVLWLLARVHGYDVHFAAGHVDTGAMRRYLTARPDVQLALQPLRRWRNASSVRLAAWNFETLRDADVVRGVRAAAASCGGSGVRRCSVDEQRRLARDGATAEHVVPRAFVAAMRANCNRRWLRVVVVREPIVRLLSGLMQVRSASAPLTPHSDNRLWQLHELRFLPRDGDHPCSSAVNQHLRLRHCFAPLGVPERRASTARGRLAPATATDGGEHYPYDIVVRFERGDEWRRFVQRLVAHQRDVRTKSTLSAVVARGWGAGGARAFDEAITQPAQHTSHAHGAAQHVRAWLGDGDRGERRFERMRTLVDGDYARLRAYYERPTSLAHFLRIVAQIYFPDADTGSPRTT